MAYGPGSLEKIPAEVVVVGGFTFSMLGYVGKYALFNQPASQSANQPVSPADQNDSAPSEESLKPLNSGVGYPFIRQECTPQEKNACDTLLKALIESDADVEEDEEGNVIFNFDLQISEKLKGYTTEAAASDIEKYNGFPSSRVANLCKGDVACTGTWFLWQHLYRQNAASGQYFFGQDGQDGHLFLKPGGNNSAVAGYFKLSKEEFERIKKEDIL